MRMAEFKHLEKGTLIYGVDGIFEVTSEYDKSRGTIGLAEVFFLDVSCDTDQYHLGKENPYTTYEDVQDYTY